MVLNQQLVCLLAERQTVAAATGRSPSAQHPVSADLLNDGLSDALSSSTFRRAASLLASASLALLEAISASRGPGQPGVAALSAD